VLRRADPRRRQPGREDPRRREAQERPCVCVTVADIEAIVLDYRRGSTEFAVCSETQSHARGGYSEPRQAFAHSPSNEKVPTTADRDLPLGHTSTPERKLGTHSCLGAEPNQPLEKRPGPMESVFSLACTSNVDQAD
jgi:hypothetical protein